MNISRLLALTSAVTLFSAGVTANERYLVPEEDPGPPAYSQVQRSFGPEKFFIPHTSEWAAIPFLREPVCIPPDFNLLNFADFTLAFPGGPPRPFICPLTVEGFAMYDDGPPPEDLAPILSQFHEVTEVPIWFVAWSELEPVASDGDLTLLELLSLPSLKVGYADLMMRCT